MIDTNAWGGKCEYKKYKNIKNILFLMLHSIENRPFQFIGGQDG
jgi:hypothetical protein